MVRQPETGVAGARGLVEGVAGDRLVGWAHDPAVPRSRLDVVAIDDRGRRSASVADIYRADLHQAGIGDGHAGFSLPMRGLDEASVRVHAGRAGVRLSGAPSPPRPAARPRRIGSILLGLDAPHLSGVRVTGWACDSGTPDRRLCLALRTRDRVLADTRASRFRPDRAAAGADPFCGFMLDWAGPTSPLYLVEAGSGSTLARIR